MITEHDETGAFRKKRTDLLKVINIYLQGNSINVTTNHSCYNIQRLKNQVVELCSDCTTYCTGIWVSACMNVLPPYTFPSNSRPVCESVNIFSLMHWFWYCRVCPPHIHTHREVFQHAITSLCSLKQYCPGNFTT